MKSAAKPGQVLILVLLVVVVSLAVGLSVASRNITNIRTSTQTEESQKAFSAAEGGIESILSQDLATFTPGADNQVTVGGVTAHVNVTPDTYKLMITNGNIGQIDLEGKALNDTIKVSWGVSGETAATVEITEVWSANSQTRYMCFYGTGGTETGTSSAQCTTGTGGYSKSATLTLHKAPHLLRIRPFGISTFEVTNLTGAALHPQMYTLTSTASTADGITRSVKVTKTALPLLPAVFDYAIYSDSAITK